MADDAPRSVSALLEDGQTSLDRGDYARAEDCFSQILTQHPNNEAARAGLRSVQAKRERSSVDEAPEIDGSIDWAAHYEAGADSTVDLPPPLAGDLIADTMSQDAEPKTETVKAPPADKEVLNPESDPFLWGQERFSSIEPAADGPIVVTAVEIEENDSTRRKSTMERPQDTVPPEAESAPVVLEERAASHQVPPPESIKAGDPDLGLPAQSILTPIDTLEEPAEVEPGEMELDALLVLAQRRYEAGDYTGAKGLVDRVLDEDPVHEQALEQKRANDLKLLGVSEAKLGDLGRCPKLKLRQEEFVWQSLNHHEGFVLSQVDGMTSFSDLIDISTLPRVEVTRILARLVELGIIA